MAMDLAMDFKAGTGLPELKRRVTQEHINLYAAASRDFNPIHIDQEFARQTPLGGTIAHGMLILAYISEFMTGHFGLSWLTTGKLSVRFKAAARPGDTLVVKGTVNGVQDEGSFTCISCDILCYNQNSEPVITGEAKVRIKTR